MAFCSFFAYVRIYVGKGLYELKNLDGKVVKKKANVCRLKPYCKREKSEAPNSKQTRPDSPPVSPPPNKIRMVDDERKAQKKCHELPKGNLRAEGVHR